MPDQLSLWVVVLQQALAERIVCPVERAVALGENLPETLGAKDQRARGAGNVQDQLVRRKSAKTLSAAFCVRL